MSVSLIPLTCPKCGGQLSIPANASECTCTYCGTQIAVDDGTVNIHVHNYNEADLKRIEIEQERIKEEKERQTKQAEYQKKWRIALIAYIAGMCVLSLVSNPFKDFSPVLYKALCTFLGLYAIVGGVGLYVQRPAKKRSQG